MPHYLSSVSLKKPMHTEACVAAVEQTGKADDPTQDPTWPDFFRWAKHHAQESLVSPHGHTVHLDPGEIKELTGNVRVAAMVMRSGDKHQGDEVFDG